ncbi:MAG: hypothetical protein ACHQJ6_04920 [Candidatus Berkiellales bacterium]
MKELSLHEIQAVSGAGRSVDAIDVASLAIGILSGPELTTKIFDIFGIHIRGTGPLFYAIGTRVVGSFLGYQTGLLFKRHGLGE